MTKEDTTVASTKTEVDPRYIGTTLTRRPEPKPVLSFAELLTIVCLRAKPAANISPDMRSGQ